MPRLTDPAAIRAILETDRSWSMYALGDMAPGFFEYTQWFAATGERPAIAMLYGAFTPPILFVLGQAADVRPLLDEIAATPEVFLHIPPGILPLINERYLVHKEARMWRMVLDDLRATSADGISTLGMDDVPALQRLYADGDAAGEAPDFFAPWMVEQQTYVGVREGGELIAAAGTHLVAPSEGVAAIGNVYTRRDRRQRGLATRLTSAVASELRRRGLRTIVLSVNQQRSAAIAVYEKLGFLRHCEFVEGIAARAG